MTLQEHYKFHSRKSIKPFNAFCFFIVFCLSLIYTSSRYTSSFSSNLSLSIAKWSVAINGEYIDANKTELNNSIYLKNIEDESAYIKAGDECYFDIIIDASLTEVSISYLIAIDLSLGNNHLPNNSIIQRYELYKGDSYIYDSTTTVNATTVNISDNYNLDNKQALDENNILKYRIYCSIPNNVNIIEGQTFEIHPVISVQQYIQ